MSVVFVDENGNSGFLHESKNSILDYRGALQRYADIYFQDNPDLEFYSISVVDFEEKRSCIYEFQRTVEYSVTVY